MGSKSVKTPSNDSEESQQTTLAYDEARLLEWLRNAAKNEEKFLQQVHEGTGSLLDSEDLTEYETQGPDAIATMLMRRSRSASKEDGLALLDEVVVHVDPHDMEHYNGLRRVVESKKMPKHPITPANAKLKFKAVANIAIFAIRNEVKAHRERVQFYYPQIEQLREELDGYKETICSNEEGSSGAPEVVDFSPLVRDLDRAAHYDQALLEDNDVLCQRLADEQNNNAIEKEDHDRTKAELKESKQKLLAAETKISEMGEELRKLKENQRSIERRLSQLEVKQDDK